MILEYPEWPRLQQAAGNALQQVSKNEDELQMSKKILLAIQAFYATRASDVSITYGHISKEVLRFLVVDDDIAT